MTGPMAFVNQITTIRGGVFTRAPNDKQQQHRVFFSSWRLLLDKCQW